MLEETKVEEAYSTSSRDASDLLPDTGPQSRWQENHGNFLMGFFCLIVVLCGTVLAYRQNRFVPPSFPDGQFIDTVDRDGPFETDPDVEAITVEVTGAREDAGRIAIAVFDAEQNFNQPKEALLAYAGEIVEGKTSWRIRRDQLPSRFAIAAYHDANLDAELNRNPFGIPTERYGFSRDARGRIGPPTFQQAVIDRPEPGATITITIR
jgi:uncharacterized protein (DUF2141 family)